MISAGIRTNIPSATMEEEETRGPAAGNFLAIPELLEMILL